MSSLIPVIITLCCWIVCDAKIQHEVEGQNAQLNFPYPCDSTKVTLQHGYKNPFYDSTDLESQIIHVHVRYLLTDQNDPARNVCSIDFTIKPISRDDKGMFILIAYKNGMMLPGYQSISLLVAYSPGKASCKLSNDYNDEEWVSLGCTAPKGTMQGQINCYQNDIKLPKLNSLDANYGETYSQTILVRLTGFVFCCSSAIDQVKDRCECKDYLWDPLQNGPIYDIPEPCPSTFPSDATQSSTQNSNAQVEKITYMNMYPPTSLQSNNSFNQETGNSGNSKYMYYLYIVIWILFLVILYFFDCHFTLWRRNSNIQYDVQIQADGDDHKEQNKHMYEVDPSTGGCIPSGEIKITMCYQK